MSWITTLESPGHITEALLHINQVRGALKTGWSKSEASRTLFDALNKVQTEQALLMSGQQLSETKAFEELILSVAGEDGFLGMLESQGLKELVDLKPQIMNHDTLRQHKYRPDQDLDPQLVKKATRGHHKLATAYKELVSQKSEEVKTRLVRRLADLLYIVRSNLAHGEKTPDLPPLTRSNF